jgi:hypothetical protein
MYKSVFFYILLLLLGSGCNKNEAYIKDLGKFVSDVEMNYKNYSKEDWLKKDKEFTELSDTRFTEIKEKLSPEERSLANDLIGKYNALKVKKEIVDFRNGIKDLLEQGKAAVKELMKDSTNEARQE